MHDDTSTDRSGGRHRRPVSEWPAVVAGVDPVDLVSDDGKRLTFDRVRYTVMGLSVIITALISGCALVAALSIATGGFSAPFLVFGLLWAVFIFNLDRWIVASIDFAEPSWRSVCRRAALALIRIVIATLIGLSIAEPVLMLVFASEVGVETARQLDDKIREARDEISRDPQYDPAFSDAGKELASATATRGQIEADINDANTALDNEEGGSGGTGKAGPGRRTAERRDDLADLKGKLDRADAEVQTATRELQVVAQRLDAAKIAAADAREADLRRRPTGLIDRATALESLARQRPAIGIVTWVARSLILLVDLSPVLLKLVSPSTVYEDRLLRKVRREKFALIQDEETWERVESRRLLVLQRHSVIRVAVGGRGGGSGRCGLGVVDVVASSTR